MHTRRLFPVLALVLAALGPALAGSCGGGPAEEAPRNVILISVDTLRADRLSCYGYERETSPRLDAWAAGGVLFEDASSTAAWTVPAHMSMLTGLYTRTHGIDGWQKILPPELDTIASFLKAQGFATGAFVNVVLLNKLRSFDRGFDDYRLVPKADMPRGATRTIVEEARAWMEEKRGGPFFLFLHFYDVHSDFNPLPRYRKDFVRMYQGQVNGFTPQLRAYRTGTIEERWGPADARYLSDLYDAGIRQFDDDIAELFDFLEQDELGAETLVVLTSDHGEEFLEHGDVMHGRTLHQELVHVPLIVRGPGVPAGLRVEGSASLVDVLPTIVAALGFEPPPQAEGVDLAHAWRGERAWDPDRPTFAEADKWLAQAEGNFRRSVRRGRYRLHYDHLTKERTVFDVDDDPLEQRDIAGDEPALVKALWNELEAFIGSKRQVEEGFELSEEDLKKLEDLGYF